MANINLKDLVKAGQEHEDEGGDFEKWTPPQGSVLKVRVVKANGRISDQDDAPGWGVWCEVTSGEHNEKRFWMNLNFSAKWDFINKRTVSNFEGFGLSAEFLSGNPGLDVVSAALEGKSGVVTIGWKKNKKNPEGRPYEDHTVAKAKSQAPPPPPEDDDADDYDDED